jgi:hypothetical protein
VSVNARSRARVTHFGGIAANPVLVEREVFVSSLLLQISMRWWTEEGEIATESERVITPGTGTLVCTCVTGALKRRPLASEYRGSVLHVRVQLH